MSDYREDLSKVLRRIRTSCGLSQREVAEALHMNRSTYTYYETAKVIPDIITLKKLAEIFSVPLETLCYPEKFTQ